MVPELEEYSLHMPVKKICLDEQLTVATVKSENHKVAVQQCIYMY